MKRTNTLLAITVVAISSLTGCNAFESKTAIDNSRTPPRAYVAAPGSDLASDDNKWMRVTPATTQTASANPADLGSIEPAAGPGATAQPTGEIISGGRIDDRTNRSGGGFMALFR